MQAYKILRYIISAVLMVAFLSIPWLYGILTDQELIVIYFVNWLWMAASPKPPEDWQPDFMDNAHAHFVLFYALSLLLLLATVPYVLTMSKILALITLTVWVVRIGLVAREELG